MLSNTISARTTRTSFDDSQNLRFYWFTYLALHHHLGSIGGDNGTTNILSLRKKFEELAENTGKSSSITQLVELTSRIRDFYMANCYILQQNRENERIKQEESKEREQVIK